MIEATTTTTNEAESETPDWTTVPSLAGTRLGQLVQSYRDLEAVQADLDSRKANLRESIRETIHIAGNDPTQPVKVFGRRIAWQPATKTFSLDRALLVQAGVSPEQLKKGTREGLKKAFLVIGPEPKSARGSLPTSGSEPVIG